MLTIIRDKNKQISAVCEWWLVDEQGQPYIFGSYVFVNQLELSPTDRGSDIIHNVIQDIANKAPDAVGAYWERREKTGHRLHGYRREQLLREGVRV